jgi:hypothetical protein
LVSFLGGLKMTSKTMMLADAMSLRAQKKPRLVVLLLLVRAEID